VTEEIKASANVWLSIALMISAACSLCAVHVSLDPHADNIFANATMGGECKRTFEHTTPGGVLDEDGKHFAEDGFKVGIPAPTLV
jgi:hypothetical protein